MWGPGEHGTAPGVEGLRHPAVRDRLMLHGQGWNSPTPAGASGVKAGNFHLEWCWWSPLICSSQCMWDQALTGFHQKLHGDPPGFSRGREGGAVEAPAASPPAPPFPAPPFPAPCRGSVLLAVHGAGRSLWPIRARAGTQAVPTALYGASRVSCIPRKA